MKLTSRLISVPIDDRLEIRCAHSSRDGARELGEYTYFTPIMNRYFASLLLLISYAHPTIPATTKPNVVFVICYSMDGQVIDPTSPVSRAVATPNIDALAASGVNFVNNYCSSPPVRAESLGNVLRSLRPSTQNVEQRPGPLRRLEPDRPGALRQPGKQFPLANVRLSFRKGRLRRSPLRKNRRRRRYRRRISWRRSGNDVRRSIGVDASGEHNPSGNEDPRDIVNDKVKEPFETDARTIDKCVE